MTTLALKCSIASSSKILAIQNVLNRTLKTATPLHGRFVYYNIHKRCVDPQQQDEEHFEQKALKLDFGPGYLDKLSEIWNEKMSVQREVQVKKDDKLVKHDSNYWLPNIDLMTPKVEYQGVEALKNAPESVKRIYSLKYGERRDLTKAWKKIMIEKVQLNPLDKQISLEARIAEKTANIRQWTMLLDSMTARKPGWLKDLIHSAVQKRRKLLRLLREQNYESFENVLNRLKIGYNVPQLPEDVPLFTRKGWVERIVRRKCDLIRQEKLRHYHAVLRNDQEKFKQEFQKTLTRLQQEADGLKRDLESVTSADDRPITVTGVYVGDTIGEVFHALSLSHFYRKPTNSPATAGETALST